MSTPKKPGPSAGRAINYAKTARADFNKASAGRPDPTTRDSSMVKRQQPKPAPRPTPKLAMGPDRAAFNARWDNERQAAREHRKAAFKAARRQQGNARSRQQTHKR